MMLAVIEWVGELRSHQVVAVQVAGFQQSVIQVHARVGQCQACGG